jgi:tRNA (guanosine-2'-O-)-methyltransferase
MRRRSEGVLVGDDATADAADAQPCSARDVDAIIETLSPLVTARRRARIEEVLAHRLASVTVVVDALHDPHNGAAIVRSCDAFGVQTLHAIERNEPIAFGREVARGSQKWVDLVRHRGGAPCVEALRASGHAMVATHPEGELVPEDLSRLPKVAIVLGNERSGIAEEIRAACTHSVRVPMVGFVESLNVSVTAAILLFAATRGRIGDLDEARKRSLFSRALRLTVPRADEVLAARRAG